jgi:hypothetical protein
VSLQPTGRARLVAALAASIGLACGPSKAIPSADVTPVRILDSRAQLVGNGPSACTHQIQASADGHRWCAFTLEAPGEGLSELWVIDVTAAVNGAVPPCDGSSGACLRLTSTLPTRSVALFDGDTLIYHVDPVSGATEDFLGRIFAWRPGWSHGRQISSDRGFTCIGQGGSSAAACFDDPGGNPAKRDSAQVRVGYLDIESGDALPAIGRWPLRNDNDTAWEAAFSPDGATFALSSAARIGETQSLWIVATADAGRVAPVVAIDDVAYWKISNDGATMYFVRGLPQQADLHVAEFPSGASAKLIEPGILSFTLIGERPADQALGFVKDLGETKGEFKLLSERRQPAPKSIFTFEDILDGAIVSPDLRYTVWMDFAFRGVVIRNGDLATCALDVGDEPPVFEPAFLDHAGLMFWKEIRPAETSRRDAFFAQPDRCRSKTPFARDIDFFVPIGDRGVIFADELDADTGRSVLKHIAVSPNGTSLDPLGAVRVQAGVKSPIVFVGGAPLLLVYSAEGASADSTGVFVYGPVPL